MNTIKSDRPIMGDIVQITNDDHKWFAVLIVVTEVRNWGIIGYALIPSNDENYQSAYIRLNNDDFQVVGKAALVLGKDDK